MAKAQKRDHNAYAEDDTAHSQEEQTPATNKAASRSCRGCYERKVRCDRADPCANCTRNGLSCVYPTKDKDAARRTTILQNICDRLERLEKLLSSGVRPFNGEDVIARTTTERSAQLPNISNVSKLVTPHECTNRQAGIQYKHIASEHTSPAQWQLLLDDEPLAASVQDQRTSPLASKQIPTTCISSQSTAANRQPGGISHHPTGLQSTHHSSNVPDSVVQLCPSPKLALHLWEIYIKFVDPIVKTLHIPTVQSAIISTILEPRSSPPATLALTFSIYFAAVTALSYAEDQDTSSVVLDKVVLLQSLRKGLDQLLLTSDAMSGPSLTSLQALAIYATCLRVHDVSRSVWILNGLAIRLAQSIGLDRDPASFSLSPFETEMRLRLWWHLCILDSRAPEDHAFQPMVDIANRHLRLPLNVNDNQLYPEMATLPLESTGWTDMTFFLTSTDSCRVLVPIMDVQELNNGGTMHEIARKRAMLQDMSQHILERYGLHSGSTSNHSMFRVAEQHSKTARLKMEFMLQLRQEIAAERSNERRTHTTPDIFKPSFKLACQTLESSLILWKDKLTADFKWFFRMYTQWYALAYVLRCLCSCPSEFDANRAWYLVDELLPKQTGLDGHLIPDIDSQRPASIWSCIRLLYSRAAALRDQALPSANLPEQGTRTSNPEQVNQASSIKSAEDFVQTSVAPIMHEDENLQAEELSHVHIDLPNEGSFPFPDMSMPDLPFLPDSDWDAVMKGWLNEGSQS